MNRRFFLRTNTLALLGASIVAPLSCRRPESGAAFPLTEVSVHDLQQLMVSGEYTSGDLVALYLRRIREVDRGASGLRSVIEINPDAADIAAELDRERARGALRGPLHGIPFLVKDNIDTGDRMQTTAGSLALAGHVAAQDAPIVTQLRNAGAVLLGKTNLSEWANFRSTRSSSGWSSRGGQTRNPYELSRNPCGSSSGSGVAVAANLCGFAIGTETNGSISCPASINGVVGLKPTVGLVSRSGIIPISATQDTAGPMTRTVRDAALVLAAITASDEQDAAMVARPPSLPKDYTSSLNTGGLRGRRIGVERSFLKKHEAIDELLRRALEQMRQEGATIVEVDHQEPLEEIGESEYLLLQYEFKDGLNKYLGQAGAKVKSLEELIEFNRAHADSVMPYFGQEILEASQGRGDLSEPAYLEARKKVVSRAQGTIDGLLKEHSLDALCGPATGPPWCTDLVNGNAFSGYGMGSGAAMAGYPSITVPMGEVSGLPVGLLFTATAFSEDSLLGIAYAYEQVSKHRRAPALQKKSDAVDH